MMNARCTWHPFDGADGVCRTCGYDFCRECLVFSFGSNETPYCRACALVTAGVRHTATRPPLRTKREIKRRHKEWMNQNDNVNRDGVLLSIGAFDESVSDDLPISHVENSPSWLGDRFDGAGERVSF